MPQQLASKSLARASVVILTVACPLLSAALPEVPCGAGAAADGCIPNVPDDSEGTTLSLLQRRARDMVNDLAIASTSPDYDIEYVPPSPATLTEYLNLTDSAQYVNLSNIVHNNLGGLGPLAGPQEMRFGEVLTTSRGGKVDLVVTAVTSYDPKNSGNNGLNGKLGQINMRASETTDFLFRFVEAGTYVPVTLSQLLFTIYDLDNAKVSGPIREQIFCGNYEKVYLDEQTSVKIVERDGHHRPIFESTVKDNGPNNPNDPELLTAEQKRHAVTFSFFAMSDIQMTFAIPKGSRNNGRNFFFSGMPLFPKCVTETVTTALTLNETEYVNLGGEGPDGSFPEAMRFKDAVTLPTGEKVDMVVKVVDTPDHEFQSTYPDKNGATHGFGRINMDRGYKANFSLEFVDSATGAPVTIKNLVFSFMDLDSDVADMNFNEKVIVGGFDKVFLSNGTDIVPTDLADGSTVFSSSTADVCDECNNPTNPALLTPEQQSRTVTLEFSEVSKFHFVVDFTVPENATQKCHGKEETYKLNATDTKCAWQHPDRLFRIEGQNEASCYKACSETLNCNYFSISESGQYDGVCMGCVNGVTHHHEPFKFFSMPCRETRSSTLAYTLNKTNSKCAWKHSDRLYRLEGQTLATCYEACRQDTRCNYFSYDQVGNYAGVCMGCTNGVADKHTNFNFYHLNKRSRNIYFGGKTKLNRAEETEFCTE